jgi:hypothetical protein
MQAGSESEAWACHLPQRMLWVGWGFRLAMASELSSQDVRMEKGTDTQAAGAGLIPAAGQTRPLGNHTGMGKFQSHAACRVAGSP